MAQLITLETRYQAVGVSAPLWSPDGRQLLFGRATGDHARRRAATCLMLLAGDGQQCRQLTAGYKPDGSSGSDFFARWSPDGQSVAFLSDRSGSLQIWMIRIAGGEAWPVTDGQTGCGLLMGDGFFACLEFTPDGKELLFAAQLPQEQEPKRAQQRRGRAVAKGASVAPAGDAHILPGPAPDYGECYTQVVRRIHLWRVPVAGGKARQITSGDYHYADGRFSPDGRSVLLACNRSGIEESITYSPNKNFDLYLLPANGGKLRPLTDNPGPDLGGRFSPDGRKIAYVRAGRCGSHADVLDLSVLDQATGKVRLLTREMDRPVDRLGNQAFSPDGRWIYFAAGVGVTTQVFRARVAGGAIEPLTSGLGQRNSCAVSPQGDRLALIHSDGRSLGELHIYAVPPAARTVAAARPNGKGKSRAGKRGALLRRPVFASNFNRFLRQYQVSTPQLIRWENEGLTIEGTLTLPRGYRAGRRYPTVVFPHGGPHSRDLIHFNFDHQLLAGRGYAVLCVNFRGSTGYGQEFVDADRGDFGGGDFRDLQAGVDHLIARGVADPRRLGILGFSYGGFMTAWAVGQTNRFAAAVAVCAVTNAYSHYLTSDLQSWARWELGDLWQERDKLLDHSPIAFTHRVKTPTLLIHGEADRRVPVSQSLEFYTALRMRGVTTQLVTYPGEGHAILQTEHVLDYWSRILAWLDRHLQGKRATKRRGQGKKGA